jgi:hypothetical protein
MVIPEKTGFGMSVSWWNSHIIELRAEVVGARYRYRHHVENLKRSYQTLRSRYEVLIRKSEIQS